MLLLTCQARARGFKIAGSGERAGQAELAGVDGGGKGRAWRGPDRRWKTMGRTWIGFISSKCLALHEGGKALPEPRGDVYTTKPGEYSAWITRGSFDWAEPRGATTVGLYLECLSMGFTSLECPF
ncbi:hypothetical protein GQ55_4G080000 [Panicum hallii var. hallii]|uniref:Uncharacterized protein n=1 Tax=Panicum hallii var. hallii TaxID=1504633 RepID=A0A2T7DWE2_9POAL|nr:hypothetical protein GQ55_4G080000 [Panicum hallii var. hallii]